MRLNLTVHRTSVPVAQFEIDIDQFLLPLVATPFIPLACTSMLWNLSGKQRVSFFYRLFLPLNIIIFVSLIFILSEYFFTIYLNDNHHLYRSENIYVNIFSIFLFSNKRCISHFYVDLNDSLLRKDRLDRVFSLSHLHAY